MKNAKKLLALLLAAVMCFGLLASCANTAETPSPSESTQPSESVQPSESAKPEVTTPLVAAVSGFEGKFSPFFASNADDVDVTDLTQMYIGGVDRVANPVLLGIEGETRAYNGTDYFYDGIGDI